MIAVIYSGSRFADWKLADKDHIIADFKTEGINPFFNDEKYILNLLNKNNTLINHAEKVKKIYFFGAGASSQARKEIVATSFKQFFRFGKIYVEHDMQAAAIATCKNEPGLVGILGSGSNAAIFDGKKVKSNNFGLGYILGDEGSANYLGRKLLKHFLNETMPEELIAAFSSKYDLDRKAILDKVYRQPQPAVFLSSFIDFLVEHQTHAFIHDLVVEAFDRYFDTYIVPLRRNNAKLSVRFVGSVAFTFEHWLRESARKRNIQVDSILKEPIYNLLSYYSDKN